MTDATIDDPPYPGAANGLQVSVRIDEDRGGIRLEWTLDDGVAERWGASPSMPIAGYDIWICLEGLCIPWETGGRLWTKPWLVLPAGIVAQSVAVSLELQVVVQWEDSTRSEAITAPFSVPALFAIPPSDEWTMGPIEVLVDDRTRRDAGLRYWPDGSIGFATFDGTTYGFASNGPACARWRIGDDRFLDEVLQVSEPIRHVPDELSYASGGSVWTDPASGAVLLFVHEEVHPDGDELRFWSAIGLAISHDQGATFTYLGRIISPNAEVDDPRRVALTEVGGAPFVIHDGAFLVYFREALASGTSHNMSVARARVDAVLDAALDGRVVAWSKHRDGSWDEPGIGGVASELFAGSPTTRWFDVVELADHDRFVMVCSDGMADEWGYLIRTSPDGIEWSPPAVVGDTERDGELLYLALAATDLTSPRRALGNAVHLYRTRSVNGGSRRWDDAVVERRLLQLGPAAGPA